jgi:DNA-binding transcriptional ArsR family regulator
MAYACAVEADISGIAALLSDPTRVVMLDALLDGRALPAGELARCARVGAPTASAHLRRLLDGGLLTVEAPGSPSLLPPGRAGRGRGDRGAERARPATAGT